MDCQARTTTFFPDDDNPLPAPGSPEQAELIAHEVALQDEHFRDALRDVSTIADCIFAEFVSACRNAVAEVAPQKPLRVLDLCSGNGILSLLLLEADFPIEELVLVDISEVLLSRARAALLGRERPNTLTLCEMDLLANDLAEPALSTFDLVIVNNAFQHFPPDRQKALVLQIHTLLRNEGLFVFGSHFKPLRPNWKQALLEGYQGHLSQRGATTDTLLRMERHINHFHRYTDLREAYTWLNQAGFSFYDCVFRKDEIGIFVAIR